MVAMENPTCIARLVQFAVVADAIQPRFHHIQLLNEVLVRQDCSVGHQCKMDGVLMLTCVPGVCFSFNRMCAFLQF